MAVGTHDSQRGCVSAPMSVWRRLAGSRSRRVFVLLVAVVILSVADLAVTLTHLKTIGMVEANPIAAFLIRSTDSSWILAAYKLLTVGICVSLLFCVRRHLVGELATWCALAILVLMSVMWHAYAQELDDTEHIRLARAGLYGDHWLVLD